MPTTESSDEDLPELTQEEIENAIWEARKKKRVQLKTQAYSEKLAMPRPMLTPRQLADLVYAETKRAEYDANGKQINLRYLGEQGYTFKTPLHEPLFWLLCLYFTNNPKFEEATTIFPDLAPLILSPLKLQKGLALFGPTGCGKTTLLTLFTDNPRESYTRLTCLSAADHFKELGSEVYKELCQKSDVFNGFGQSRGGRFFDDLGRESIPVTHVKNFKDERNLMADVLEQRGNLGDSVVGLTHFTTNLTADQIGERYGARVRSRLRQMVNVIQFPPDAPDLRE